MRHVTHKSACRLCGSRALELVLPIRPSPIGDAFVTADRLQEKQELFPLDCYLCGDCGHLQNLDVVDPEILFRDYTYRTSVSLGLVEHFKNYARSVVSGLAIPKGSLVVEIGSNDGSLLKAFQAEGMRVQGIDPARDIAKAATDQGVSTRPDFFTSAIAAQIVADSGHARLFCANNVFAHIDNLSDVASGIRSLLAPDGVFVFEVSYIVDMIDNMVFDTIYHEHVSHHALLPLEAFLNRHGLTLFDVMRTGTKGGSIRGFAQLLSTGKRMRSPQLSALMEEEARRRITGPEIYRGWFGAIEHRKDAVLAYLDAARGAGKTVAGYGASTTTTTLLYHFELASRLAFIADDNPLKQGRFSPAAHIPVLPSGELTVRKPDIVVILAWIYAEPIIARNAAFIDGGGTFVVPLPVPKAIDRNGPSPLGGL
ncbi:MAG TPA: class I SAM-dependent methyltransferase [Bradyrhizobium sp.]|uniref:class I SAM-dependent methyltransferase n=1 Tax=Bradyrhizobium sp. TaxID=376 RepID=UPI002C7A9261|nr:class I SAM-dependent methyltransferase [Bradyrhizobium sp.]HLZ01407.1 class I SAM-dependent methyltransferase [Bradyrhizobium sp.]